MPFDDVGDGRGDLRIGAADWCMRLLDSPSSPVSHVPVDFIVKLQMTR